MIDSDNDELDDDRGGRDSVQSEQGAHKKKHRRKRKRGGGKIEGVGDSLSLNLEKSFQSGSEHSSSSNLSLQTPEEEDDDILLAKLRNFEVRNKVYPTSVSSSAKNAQFFVLKAVYEEDVHKVVVSNIVDKIWTLDL